MTELRHGPITHSSYHLLPFDRLQMAAVVANLEHRIAGASEEEINRTLDGRDIKNTKNIIKTTENILIKRDS